MKALLFDLLINPFYRFFNKNFKTPVIYCTLFDKIIYLISVCKITFNYCNFQVYFGKFETTDLLAYIEIYQVYLFFKKNIVLIMR